jgi:hypothetical protein
MDAPTTSTTNTTPAAPTYNVPAFNSRDKLVTIHQALTDHIHYQSHIHLTTALTLLPSTLSTNCNERKAIIALLKEEMLWIDTLRHLLNLIDTNIKKVEELYKVSRSSPKRTGENSHGDCFHNGKHRDRPTTTDFYETTPGDLDHVYSPDDIKIVNNNTE